ncbi:hypothetical protein HDU76_002273, partial [Blyttiomyces sp. JEL0837]
MTSNIDQDLSIDGSIASPTHSTSNSSTPPQPKRGRPKGKKSSKTVGPITPVDDPEEPEPNPLDGVKLGRRKRPQISHEVPKEYWDRAQAAVRQLILQEGLQEGEVYSRSGERGHANNTKTSYDKHYR